MVIKIYGTKNCKNCDLLFENVVEALKILDDSSIVLKKETSLVQIAKNNISSIPALEINDSIISEGFVYSIEDIIKLIKNEDISNAKNNVVCDEKGCRLINEK